MITLSAILVIVALVLGVVALFNVPSRFNLVAAAVVLLAVAGLIGRVILVN